MIAPLCAAISLAIPLFGARVQDESTGDPHYLRIDRGPDELPLLVPRDEELTFEVIIDVGILGNVHVGDVTLASGVELISSGLPDATSDRHVQKLERGWIRSTARGGYAGYNLLQILETSLLPHDWPRVFATDTQTGSENRRRELRMGLRDGVVAAEYKSDKHCEGCDDREHFVDSIWAWGKPHHCEKCKRAEHRVWRDPVSRTVPSATVDMLSAVYLARSLVRENLHEASFPLVDKQTLWRAHIEQGTLKRKTVSAGTFDCRQVKLSSTMQPDDNPASNPKEKFQGLFGIQGAIQIWFDAHSGVPVLIEGELPIPVPLVNKLDVSVRLKSHKGTPETFLPAR